MKRLILLFLSAACFAQANGPAPFYQAYIGSAIVQPPATPNLGNLVKNGAVTVDTSFPSGTPSKVIRCTDQNTNPSLPNGSLSAGIGGSGDGMPLFNANDTFLRVNTQGGQGLLIPFNPYTLSCGPALNESQNLTSPGSASTVANFGGGYFDWQNPSLYTGQSGAALTQYTINPSGTFSVGNTVVNFQNAIPYGSLVAAWQASTAYTSGQYVTYTLTSSQAPDWTASNAYSTLGTVILPTVNNPLGCAFKLVTAGTSSGTEPTWSTSGTCTSASNSVLGDGSAGWRNLGGTPTFVFQLTSSNCTSGSSTPAFVPTGTGRPDLMTTVSDGSCTWTNVGPEVPLKNIIDLAGVSYDGTRICEDFSTNVYGYNNNYTGYNGGQGTGQWVSCYSSTTNTYITLNTVTGWQSTVTCTGGTGYNCSGGTQVMNPVGVYPLITSGGCGFFMHNSKGSWMMDYPVIVQQAFLSGASGCITGDAYSWYPFASFNTSTTLQGYLGNLNHWAEFNSHLLQVGQSSNTFGFTTGAYTNIYDSTNPYTLADILISWQPTCTTSWSAGNTLPPCQFGLAYDSHMSAAHNPAGQDISPACGTMYDLTSISVVNAPWQNEEICIPMSPTWANGSSPVGQNAPWRFSHTFNTGTNSFFDTQFGISQLSTDGRLLAFSSDWFCTLGTVSGGSSSLCGLTWTPSTAYTSGQLLNPFSSFTGSGTNYGVYKVTTAGTSASSAPTWVTCTDNTVSVTSGHAGTGYVVGDQISIVQSGASGGTQIVTSIGSGGTVTGLGSNSNGTGYTTATGLSTTGGSGTGLEVSITAAGNSGTTVTDGAGVVYTCQGKSNGVGHVFIVQLAPFPVAFTGGIL